MRVPDDGARPRLATFVAWVRDDAVVPETPLPPAIVDRVSRATHGLVSALACLHGAGFVHRDVKPENVLVDGATGRGAPVRLRPRGSLVAAERPGYLYGTSKYTAPELLQRGDAVVARETAGRAARREPWFRRVDSNHD